MLLAKTSFSLFSSKFGKVAPRCCFLFRLEEKVPKIFTGGKSEKRREKKSVKLAQSEYGMGDEGYITCTYTQRQCGSLVGSDCLCNWLMYTLGFIEIYLYIYIGEVGISDA